MRNKITLIFLLILLWSFLIFFQISFPETPSTFIIIGFITLYCVILGFAQIYFIPKPSGYQACDTKDACKEHVNIVIPAHNEAMVLKNTVEHLVNIDYPSYDILIMNDRSVDDTEKIAKQLSEKFPGKVKYYNRSKDSFPGKSAVLNEALSMTSGELVCVFDADARVELDFLNKVLPCLEGDDIAAVQCRKAVLNKDQNALTRFQHYEYCMDAYIQHGRNSLKGAVELRGNGQVIKRKVLVEINGWNELSLTDDVDLSTKLHLAKYDIRFCHAAVVYEEALADVIPIIYQHRRWAEGSIRRYLDYSKDIITSKNISLRVVMDMLAYFSELILPVWLVSGFIIQLLYLLFGGQTDILMNIILMLVIDAFFIVLLFVSIRKWENYGILKSFWWAFLTSIYVIFSWTIIVTLVVVKILFRPRDMKWYKTNHGSANLVKDEEVNERS